jgi:hypothetical protein
MRYIDGMPRYFRIAAAVAFALLAAAMIGLWVRSYWQADSIVGPIGSARYVGIGPREGTLYFSFAALDEVVPRLETWHMRSVTLPVTGYWPEKTHLGFAILRGPGLYKLGLPFWLLVPSSLGLGALLGFKRWRFGLHTLLIATTAIAAILGLVFYRGP